MLRLVLSFSVALLCVSAQNTSVDTAMTAKIRAEATGASSQVSQIFETLTIDIGPRLTASPAFFRAVDFAMEKLKFWGLENTRREAWKFGRGWTLDKLTLEMVEPRYAPLIGYAEGWSPSTAGELTATPVYLGNKTAAEIDALKPSLKGAIVMPAPPQQVYVREDRRSRCHCPRGASPLFRSPAESQRLNALARTAGRVFGGAVDFA